jgi:hypothetical protein
VIGSQVGPTQLRLGRTFPVQASAEQSAGGRAVNGSPVRGARSAGRRPDLDRPAGCATIPPRQDREHQSGGRQGVAALLGAVWPATEWICCLRSVLGAVHVRVCAVDVRVIDFIVKFRERLGLVPTLVNV